ncbi:MAG: spermidine synthase [Halioglobus sp.]|jgi:spermidine synthase
MFRVYLLCLVFLSGAAALIYEVAWTRSLSLFIGSDALSSSAVITAFMSGLALGAILFRRMTKYRTRTLVIVFSCMEFGVAIFGFVSITALASLQHLTLGVDGGQILSVPSAFLWKYFAACCF